MDAKHTPTPWEADGDSIVAPGAMCRYKTIATINYSSTLPITNAQEAKKVAAFIVRAVNAYNENQSTIEWLRQHKDHKDVIQKELDDIKHWLSMIERWEGLEDIGKAVKVRAERLTAIAKDSLHQ